jgi:1,4-alpha-glucan branching enzyme
MSNVSTRPGMGAVPYDDNNGVGTTFRVWAKFATQVWVTGTFNNWSVDANPLVPEGNGYWSVDVADVKPDVGERYRYVIASPFIDGVQWRTDPYCKSVQKNENSDGGIVSGDYDWTGDNFTSPQWNELVIYEMHVASFNRDNAVPGNFDSIITKLDYLRDLGINAIELMPISEFPDQYSLGYDPAFPFDIESNYGLPADFKDFIKAAHQYGIAVILDIVINHFGPYELDESLYRLDGWNENNKSGIYFYNDDRSVSGFGDRPDYGRPEVRNYLRDNVMIWLDEYRVDGLRFDSTVNIRNANGNNNDPANDLQDGWNLLQNLNNEIDSRMPWKITIAEDLQDNEWITKPTSSQGAGFDSQWDSFFYWKLYNAIVTANDEDRNMADISEAIAHSLGDNESKRTVFINNHDQCAAINHNMRLPERIWIGHADSWIAKKRYTLAAAIVFTTPGIPLIFQGDEFLEWGTWDPSDTLDWNKKDQFAGILELFKSLIHLRRNIDTNAAGLKGQHVNVFHVNNNDKLVAYHRWENGGPGDDTIIVANFANKLYDSYTIGFPRAGTWYTRFNSDWNGYSADFGNAPGYNTTAGNNFNSINDDMPYTGNIGIGPYSVIVLSQ